ncbi:MAG TPA: BON domain-containing protein [Chloroflexota bacterium]
MKATTRIQKAPQSATTTGDILPSEDAPTDPKIALDVRQALTGYPLALGEHIHFTVAQGWVTLTGQVDRPRRRENAVRIVEQVSGVSGVSDLILIAAHTPPIEPHAVHQAIEEALHRRGSGSRSHFRPGRAGDADPGRRCPFLDGAAGHSGRRRPRSRCPGSVRPPALPTPVLNREPGLGITVEARVRGL